MNNALLKYKVIPLRHGFISINPKPIGVVHLIGGYFFGTGVNFWYKNLIDSLRKQFTVHAYSYPFTQLSHWRIAHDLLEEIEEVKLTATKEATRYHYSTDIYDNPDKHCLVGHSLGCECIALIRFLGLDKDKQMQVLERARKQLGSRIVTNRDIADVENLPQNQAVPYKASLLMAPSFQTPNFVNFLLHVRPRQKLVRYLIGQENLGLLPSSSLISFKGDTIAADDVIWLYQELRTVQSLINFQEIEVSRRWWNALQYHMIPAFAPIKSGLSDVAAKFISQLISQVTEKQFTFQERLKEKSMSENI